MSQQIRDRGDHIGFRIYLLVNNTWSGPHKEHVF